MLGINIKYEEDQGWDRDPQILPGGMNQHYQSAGRGEGSGVAHARAYIWAREQHRLQAAIADVDRVLVRADEGARLLPQHGRHVPGRDDRPREPHLTSCPSSTIRCASPG